MTSRMKRDPGYKLYVIQARWTVSDDGKVVTFELRKGMKWSDGAPFTADDILFWYEDILLNKELTPAVSEQFKAGGEVVKVQKLDGYTVEFRFAKPYAGFVNYVAMGQETYAPKHYLKQFHPNYVSKEELEIAAKEAGFEYWWQYFNFKAGTQRQGVAPGKPTLHAWVCTTSFSDPTLIANRNPYYWKVDTAGNQLPYLNELRRELVSSVEVMVLKQISGEIDFQTRHLWTLYDNLPVFVENQKKGDYRILRTQGGNPGRIVLFPNQTAQDPVKRELFRNRKFRIALSLAINRDEVNNLIFQGMARTVHGHLHPTHPAYSEELDRKYTEYDPERANQLLDELGLKKDSSGFRLGPDGKPLKLTLMVSTHHVDLMKGAELVVDYWKSIGLNVSLKAVDRTLFNVRRDANEAEIHVWSFTDPLLPFLSTNHSVIPEWAPLWHEWLTTDGESGEEPPAEVKRLWTIYTEEAPMTADPEKRKALAREVVELWSENVWGIGLGGVPWNLAFAKNGLRNIPKEPAHTSPANPGIYRPFQWFWDRGER